MGAAVASTARRKPIPGGSPTASMLSKAVEATPAPISTNGVLKKLLFQYSWHKG